MQAIPKCRATIAAVFVARLLAALSAFWMATACAAPSGGDQTKSPKVFATDGTLALTLTAPWREFMRNKSEKKRYPGTLEYVDESGAKHAMPLAVAARGHNRLKVCRFPPVKLIFDKEAIKGTPFRGSKSLKLVTHCAGDQRSEQDLVREMLAYRIYNLITPRSFRIRPLSVTYVDSADRAPDGPHHAFLIEDDSDLARRNDLPKLDVPTLDLAQLEPLEASRFSLFEYLIGNTDFAVLLGTSADRCCHNAVLIGENKPSMVFAVPYDFDSSGLVDTRYSTPSPVLKISSNRERVFRGFCAKNATLEAARREMLRLEPQVLDLVRSEPLLDAQGKATASDYLSKGFDDLRDDEKFARDIIAKCRK